jgi:hypothetical protein
MSGHGHRRSRPDPLFGRREALLPSRLTNKEKLIVSAKTANKHSTLLDDTAIGSSAATCTDDSMQASVNLSPSDAETSDWPVQDGAAITVADDQHLPPETGKPSIDRLSEAASRPTLAWA